MRRKVGREVAEPAKPMHSCPVIAPAKTSDLRTDDCTSVRGYAGGGDEGMFSVWSSMNARAIAMAAKLYWMLRLESEAMRATHDDRGRGSSDWIVVVAACIPLKHDGRVHVTCWGMK